MQSIRLAHISDIHVTAEACRWNPADYLNKRMAAWFNLRFLGRGRLFRMADVVIAALLDDLRQRQPDRVIFSGDATALGFEEEMHRAVSLLGLHGDDVLPGLAVPGNHDYCTHHAVSSGHFERHFAPWLQGERLDSAVYPFAQKVGGAWLIGVNSARANRWAWDASGHVGPGQLQRLNRLLRDLPPGPRILVTHYPVTRASGKLEFRSHRLSDVHDLAETAREGGVNLWLHGHVHRPYRLDRTFLTPFPVICAGSSTQSNRWSYFEYTLTGHHLRALRRTFSLESGKFQDDEFFEINLPAGG